MNRYFPIYLYGAIIIIIGIFLTLSNDSYFNVIKWTLAISLIVGSAIAVLAAFTRQRKQVEFAYHEMHALAMFVYGISILLFCNTVEKLISLTSFIFIFYTFSEIIFCNWLFNLEQKIKFQILIIRLALGLVVGIGTIIAINYTDSTIEIFGILFILVGINILIYVPILKERHSLGSADPSNQVLRGSL